MDKILTFAYTLTWTKALLIGGALFALWLLWKVQRSPNKVDLTDLVLDTDGKASWTKLTAIGAFLVSSSVMLMLTFDHKMSDFLFLFYVGVYSGVPVAYRYLASRIPPPPPQQTVTTTTPADSKVETKVTPPDKDETE